jgi:hypothetical protein
MLNFRVAMFKKKYLLHTFNMDLDLVQMLADPGTRQLVVGVTGAVVGAVHGAIANRYETRPVPAVLASTLGTAPGIEAMSRGVSPIANSYLVEGVTELFSSVAGYALGRGTVTHCARMLRGDSGKF